MNKYKTKKFIIILLILIFFNVSLLVPSEKEEILLNEIAGNIEKYRNKTVTIRLRLRSIDRIFDKIVFYDRKNHDIAFDISEIKRMDSFKREILNAHEGMVYLVAFTVKGVGNLGEIIGELLNFEIGILNKLPEG